MKQHPIAAIISYNSIEPLDQRLSTYNNKQYLNLGGTFSKKNRTLVKPDDLNWQLLLSHKRSLKKVIIFAGKKSSGALEIIKLACESFKDTPEVLYFILCWHELSEKEALLSELGIPQAQYMCFKDGHLPCQETPLLKGYLHHFLDTLA